MAIEIRFHQPIFTKKDIREDSEVMEVKVCVSALFVTVFRNFILRGDAVLNEQISLPDYKNLIVQRGRSGAQGLLNHKHLEEFSWNRVHQFKLGVLAIHLWSAELSQKFPKKRFTIYLDHGAANPKKGHYTLCLYTGLTKSMMRRLEASWPRPVTSMPVTAFKKWADKKCFN